jgi:hypothetical protein
MQVARFPRLYRILHYGAAAGGWFLYFYELVRISWQTPRRELVSFAILLILTVLLMHLVIVLWIAHNKLKASKGKRGLCTRYIVPAFSRDYVGRQLVLDEVCWISREIVVRVDGGTKCYSLAPELE